MTGPIVYADVEQRSEAWHALRLGRLCGSRAADMCATIKSGEAAARRNLRVELMLERLTGRRVERDLSGVKAVQDGVEREPAALRLYEAETGRLIERVGFLAHPELAAGCSPDGLADEGIVEVKCPQPSTHLEYLQTRTVPDAYVKQCVHGLWISGAAWCDFVSYQPDFTGPLEALQLVIIRIERDAIAVAEYELRARAFLREVDLAVAAVLTLADTAGRLRAVHQAVCDAGTVGAA